MDNGLLTELLDAITAVHSFLSKDIAKDKLSSKNHKARHSFIQQLDQLLTKIRSAKDNATANQEPKSEPHPPPITPNRLYPQMKPPAPLPPTAIEPDEGGELYEVPDQKEQPEPSSTEYSSFLPITLNDEEPQEEYLAMEAEQKETIEEEMYEDPSQTPAPPPPVSSSGPPPSVVSRPPPSRQTPPISPAIQPPSPDSLEDQEPGLYEDPLMQNPSSQSVTTPPPEAGGYMDPVRLSTDDNRKSFVPVELIDDWDSVYDNPNKKKEKIKASKLKNVTMKGWLDKLGGRSHKNWQKRYCVLSELFMYFYEKESSATYNNRIPIPGFVPNPSSELTLPKKSQYAFKLSSTDSSGKSKDYYFRTKTEGERDDWVSAIRTIFEHGRAAIEKRKSFTLPSKLSGNSLNTVLPLKPVEDIPEQEEYEALDSVMIPEEDDQEEYIDVSQATDALQNATNGEEDPQEEYMDVQSPHLAGSGNIEEEPQEDYVEPTEIRNTLTNQKASSSSIAPPLPPAPKQPLPPPPLPSQDNATPTIVTPPPPIKRPEPVVDTNKIYVQPPNGILYSNVYVILWDFAGIASDELNVKRGDLVLVEKPQQGEEWWLGEVIAQDCSRKLGQQGLFPANYCTVAFEVA